MHGLKSAILAILPEMGHLAGLAMPCQCSPPFSSIENDRKWLLYQLLPIKYELKLPSEVTPGLLPFKSRSKQCELGHNHDKNFFDVGQPWRQMPPKLLVSFYSKLFAWQIYNRTLCNVKSGLKMILIRTRLYGNRKRKTFAF